MNTVNEWQKLDLLPASKLKIIIPKNVWQRDIEGLQNIHTKSQELKKLELWKERRKSEHRNQLKDALKKRHDNVSQLEIKCGIAKTRAAYSSERFNVDSASTYGMSKNYKHSSRIEELSRVKIQKNGDSYKHADFRGILQVDFPIAISKLGYKS